MDEQLFFKTHQELLLKIANSQEGRFLLGEEGNYPIVKVTPESYHMMTGAKKGEFKAVFFTDNRLAYKLGAPLYKILLANEHKDVGNTRKAFLHYANLETNYSKYPQIYLISAIFNPASGEGTMNRQDEATWAAARDAATSDGTNSGAQIESTYTGNPSQFYLCFRAAQPFSTSSLTPSAAVKTPITYEAYRDDSQITGGNPFANANSTSLVLVPSTQADPTTIATTDFNQLSFVSKGSINLASTSNGAYFSVSITDTSLINNLGYTKIYAITGLDLNNTQPGSGASANNNRMAWQTRSQSNPAKLTVTYDLLGGGFLFLLD